MLSTESDARIVRENSNDLKDLHRFDKSGKTITRLTDEQSHQQDRDQLKFDSRDKDDETAARTTSLEAKTVVEDDEAMTEKGLADSEASLESAEQNCAHLAQDHEATMAGRAEELKVIVEAKKVLMGTTSETNVKRQTTQLRLIKC